ncbi:hypothetical protein B0A54_17987 [Friedmanniomyces endolithicus]|uniref:Cytochrome P450 n=1 Tax=Friedmanniomyces endolithicus TaxID=329885 RepID=A0A4U0TME5_9PEZI|nr:hypothetical protein LTS09_018130 [Friedmanniomyces endolithicus]TKA23114.1 hypothetical protein B0A54_17987 [Friedmanniomyces endolithicus]
MLLEDGAQHRKHKRLWQTLFANVVGAANPLIRDVTLKAFVVPLKKIPAAVPLDLYETLKTLAWDILLAIFLGVERDNVGGVSRNVENLQGTILRGQFSLFPAAVRTPFWTSPRSRGLKAVQDLEPAVRSLLRSQWESSVSGKHETCPFTRYFTPAKDCNDETLSEDDLTSHVRLFTSSIANKALASLLTAFFMNRFMLRDRGQQEQPLANLIRQQQDFPTRRAILSSALRETMRLRPPVIGVMRRVTQTVRLTNPGSDRNSTTSHIVPAAHDAWLYFVAANRDPDVFARPTEFCWDRFMRQGAEVPTDEDCGIAFGLGPKHCLGADLTREICLTVAETVMESGLAFKGGGQVVEGVKAWLGWEAHAGPEGMTRDLKQLPCQRPRDPVMVTVTHAK